MQFSLKVGREKRNAVDGSVQRHVAAKLTAPYNCPPRGRGEGPSCTHLPRAPTPTHPPTHPNPPSPAVKRSNFFFGGGHQKNTQTTAKKNSQTRLACRIFPMQFQKKKRGGGEGAGRLLMAEEEEQGARDAASTPAPRFPQTHPTRTTPPPHP